MCKEGSYIHEQPCEEVMAFWNLEDYPPVMYSIVGPYPDYPTWRFTIKDGVTSDMVCDHLTARRHAREGRKVPANG